MKVFDNILQSIGNTPMIKLNKTVTDIPATVYAKVEYFNPGNSVKDRIGLKMVEDAEKAGLIKPGGTIIEGTSGNTGMGLALACIVKGYKLICTTNDKQSKEKVDALRALGAEVIVCPTNVEPDDPRSYYSVAKRLAKEIPNSYYPNQYDNLSNRQAHYESTGPEIWEQTEGKVTHFVVGAGTGGTISGVGRYLKEKNPNIKIWGIDTYGSVFKKYKETGIFDRNEIYAYITEGIGEDILPANVDFDIIDLFEKVTDKDGALAARELAKKEGIWVGYSAGSALAGIRQLKHLLTPEDVVVVLFHDHGSRYLGKIYNDDWMRDREFISKEKVTVLEMISSGKLNEAITVNKDQKVEEIVELFTKNGISQVPVTDDKNIIGSVTDIALYTKLIADPSLKSSRVEDIMGNPFAMVNVDESLEAVSALLNRENPAVLSRNASGKVFIITKQDVIQALC